jgi:hypothetical protein
VGGGSYALGWNSLATNASSSLSNFNPSVTAQLQALVSQPLLRDFKIDRAARRSHGASERADRRHRPQELGTRVGARAARLLEPGARAGAVAVQQQSLDLSLELERNNRRAWTSASRRRSISCRRARKSRSGAKPHRRADARAAGRGSASAADSRSEAGRTSGSCGLEPADMVPRLARP